MIKNFLISAINCHNPVAPDLDLALGCNADSTIAKYFNSSGNLNLSNSLSKRGGAMLVGPPGTR